MDYSQDPVSIQCYKDVRDFFEANQENVFYTKQLEIFFEKDYFHWITNRAIQELYKAGTIHQKKVELSWGGNPINLYWHKSYRYYKTAVKRVAGLVDRYSDPQVTRGIGDTGELLVCEAFTRNGFIIEGIEANSFNGITWEDTGHDLDYIFSRDGRVYGVEIKNTLSYMEKEEFNIKVAMCETLGILPMFVNRYFPGSYAKVLRKKGSYVFTMGYQLYPTALDNLAKEVSGILNLPVDSPRRIQQGTMDKFINWHNRQL